MHQLFDDDKSVKVVQPCCVCNVTTLSSSSIFWVLAYWLHVGSLKPQLTITVLVGLYENQPAEACRQVVFCWLVVVGCYSTSFK